MAMVKNLHAKTLLAWEAKHVIHDIKRKIHLTYFPLFMTQILAT